MWNWHDCMHSLHNQEALEIQLAAKAESVYPIYALCYCLNMEGEYNS